MNYLSSITQLLDFSFQRPIAVQDVAVSELSDGRYGIYYVLKNTRDNQYIRLSEREYFIWGLLDGKRQVKEIWVRYFLKYKTLAFSGIADLISILKKKGFIISGSKDVYNILQNYYEKKTLGYRLNKLKELFFQKTYPLKNIDGVLNILHKNLFYFLFSRPAKLFYPAVSVAGAAIFIIIIQSGEYSLFQTGGSYTYGFLTYFLIDIALVTIHELAHAFSVKSYGREVREAGLVFYFGFPCFYADTTDIWLETRKRRMAVSWAGPYSELIVGSICALCAAIMPSFYFNDLLVKVAFFCYVDVFLNLNPLWEMDGYFMLVDYLDIPMLRKKSFDFWKEKVWEKLKNAKEMRSEEKIYIIFGALAGVWTVFAVCMALILLKWRMWEAIVDLTKGTEILAKIAAVLALLLYVVPMVVSFCAFILETMIAAVKAVVRSRFWRRGEILLSDFKCARMYYPAKSDTEKLLGALKFMSEYIYGVVRKRHGILVNKLFGIKRDCLCPGSGDVSDARVVSLIESIRKKLVFIEGNNYAHKIFCRAYDLLYWDEREILDSFVAKKVGGKTKMFYAEKETFDIISFLKEMYIFKSMADHDVLALSKRVRIEEFREGAVIFKEGQRGDKFYMIKKGAVEVYNENEPLRALAILGERDYFGELALINDKPRSASIRAVFATTALVIRKIDFENMLKSQVFGDRQLRVNIENLEIISKLPFFYGVNHEDVKMIAKDAEIRTYDRGEYIIKKGERGDEFYIMTEGEAIVYDDGKEIAQLAKGEYFGEVALFMDTVRIADVKAVVKTKVVVIRKDSFDGLIARNREIHAIMDKSSSRRMMDLKNKSEREDRDELLAL